MDGLTNCCMLCLELNQDAPDCITADSPKWQELNVLYIIEMHLWQLTTVKSNSLICSSCWHALDNFHKFYQRTKEVHLKLDVKVEKEDTDEFIYIDQNKNKPTTSGNVSLQNINTVEKSNKRKHSKERLFETENTIEKCKTLSKTKKKALDLNDKCSDSADDTDYDDGNDETNSEKSLEQKRYSCNVCGICFVNPESLKLHKSICLTKDGKNLSCKEREKMHHRRHITRHQNKWHSNLRCRAFSAEQQLNSDMKRRKQAEDLNEVDVGCAFTVTHLKEMSDLESVTDVGEDEMLQNLLLSWNAERMFEFFKSENISIKVLKIIDLEQLKDLTKTWKIGDKILFSYHFKNWRLQNKLPFENPEINKIAFEVQSKLYSNNNPAEPACNSSDSDDCINLLDILKANKIGLRILQCYKNVKFLNEEQRNLVISVIVRHFVEKGQHMSLNISYKLEEQILSTFPTERKEFYRTERRGKIYTKYSNMKKATKMVLNDDNNLPTTSKSSKQQFVPEEGSKLMAQSLLNENLSAEDFESTWSACTSYRLHQIRTECQNIGDILNIWPQFKKPNGFKLIDKDFSFLYASHDPLLTWGSEKLLKLYQGIKNPKTKKSLEANKLLEIVNIEDAENDLDTFALRLLWTLHHILSPTGKYVRTNDLGKKELTRFTTKDSLESFLFIGNNRQELEDHVEFLKTREETKKPSLLAIGDTNNCHSFFVCLDGKFFQFSSLLRALDVCFKMYHVFNLKYPKPSEAVWIFIETYFYSLRSKIKNSKVCIFLDSLQKM